MTRTIEKNNAHRPENLIDPSWLSAYYRYAENMASKGENKLAEMVMQLIIAHNALTKEVIRLRDAEQAREMDMMVLRRENQALMQQIKTIKSDRAQLIAEVKQLKQGNPGTPKKAIKKPPSWR